LYSLDDNYHNNNEIEMHQSLHLMKSSFNNFSIIEHFESMQTINDKRKYTSQQLFEMLSLALTQVWSRLLHWSIPLSMMVCQKSAQTLTSCRFSSARSCIGFLYMRSCTQPQILWSTGFRSTQELDCQTRAVGWSSVLNYKWLSSAMELWLPRKPCRWHTTQIRN